ncbi:alanine--tRNA ligase [Candidatus Symbiobacter mobilis]|uniref:Alanine--tRNA ligase n=1 Tax=Candidatus Symbiobacter mobilis CR TaxID=946483 RepID=U5NA98_9BURK|nr:alanine--tRNA ligase [Candidatus Symbiobacter mobilis]AGX88245.1 alanyl-tRNA synthetase [Candidatus Symbiobacter mobilis CR]
MTSPIPPSGFASVAQIRKTFLDFFAERGHTVVESSPLVPGNDPTLMFTNSGMVQFKDVFLGTDRRGYVRAASVQACLRAGGKHNDLENVGYTARHHTFFEMLGNWSFGDYFKREALQWAWELLTKVYGLPADRLWATVYIDDDDAYDIWTTTIGLPANRVVRIGDNKGAKYASDNFWMMADTGPCGPCSEIFYDHGPGIPGGPPGSAEQDGDRFIEIWNNVFMQFDMQPDGSLLPLPAPCVDTGMGLERLAAILQQVHSNYEIDLFRTLIDAAQRVTQCPDAHNDSLKVIADHIRAAVFLVKDGVLPGNEGRGYVQRRIIRRAIRHGYKLGCREPFFHRLVADVAALMGDAYPPLSSQVDSITDVLRSEEERFLETLEVGLRILDEALVENDAGSEVIDKDKGKGSDKVNKDGTNTDSTDKVLRGEVAFRLHDTFGFPLDLTADVCRERGWRVDEAGFAVAMDKQKSQARAAGKFRMDKGLDYDGAPNAFVGYERLTTDTTILALYADDAPVDVLEAGVQGAVILAQTPFYGESGGQVGDAGTILGATGAMFDVADTQKLRAEVWVHRGKLAVGTLRVGDAVTAHVDALRRAATERNHSATHLLHKALREVLGVHVQQKGSLVDAQRTRFDFAHHAPVSEDEVREIEARVNADILANTSTSIRMMDLASARQTGAMMLFGEKYGDTVRVLDIGASCELCGGTHVRRTGDIGLCKVVAQSSVASGVRRIEAVTGTNALEHVQQQEDTLHAAAAVLKVPVSGLEERVTTLLDRIKSLDKEISALQGRLQASAAQGLLAQARDVAPGVRLLAVQVHEADAKALRDTARQLAEQLRTGVVVLATVLQNKVQLAACVTPDLLPKVHAGQLVAFLAAQLGGKGGGKPDLAMAGGTDITRIDPALHSAAQWVAQRVG